MTRVHTGDITAADIFELLREYGPCPSSRLVTLLQLAGRDVNIGHVQPVLDALVHAGDVLELRRRAHRWSTTGSFVIVYQLAASR